MAAFAEGALINQLTSTVASGGNLTLTVTSTSWQRITGTTTHTITLPDATTMRRGREFVIANESTGDVTVNYNSSGLAAVISSGSEGIYRLFSNSTSDGTWTISGGGGGANTFDDIPLAPSFSGQDVAVGPSTNGGIDLVINNTKVAKTSSTTVNIKQNGAITKYSNNEFYSGIVSYNPSTDTFDVQYSADSHVDSATALANLPSPANLTYDICNFSSEITAVTPGNTPRTLYYRYDLNTIYNADISGNIIEQASFTTESSTRDMAVSFSNNNFAIAYYDFGTGTNRIRLYNLTTFAFISEVSSTTTSSGNPQLVNIAYDSSVSRYVIFTITDNSYPGDYLITEHNPVTGAEVTGATGAASVFAPWNGPKHIVYVSSINAFLGVYNNYGYYDIQDVSKSNHATSNVLTGLSEDSFLGYDSATDELWHYKTDNTAKVYDVTAGPTLTFNRNETTSFLNLNSQVGATSFQFSGNVLDTVSPTSLDDTRQSINNTPAKSFFSPSTTTITTDNEYLGILVEGDLTVDGNVTVNGDVHVKGDLTINGTLNVLGNVGAYNITVQTTNNFEFEVNGSIQLGNSFATCKLTSSKFFNVGGDIAKQFPDKTVTLDFDVTTTGSTTTMYIGGNIKVDGSIFTILDDGVTDGNTNYMEIVVGGSIYGFVTLTSETVAADRKITPPPELTVRGDLIGNLNINPGNNSFASTNAYGAKSPVVYIEGDLINDTGGSSTWRTGDGTGTGGRCGDFGWITVAGDLIFRSILYFGPGASNSATEPTHNGILLVYGDCNIHQLIVNFHAINTGAGALPKFCAIQCNGKLSCRQDLTFGRSTTYNAITGTATWHASEFLFQELKLANNTNYPPGCLNFTAWRGFSRISVGRFQLYPGQVLPGFVAGTTGTSTKVPDSIFTGTGMAVRRDATGSGTTYIWIEV